MRILLLFIIALSVGSRQKKTLYLVGDSTMAQKETGAFPETGWGMPFAYFFDSTIVVENHARNGRSTRTFISENRWSAVYSKLAPGDYVFIQFGHNDESVQKTDRYTSIEDYKKNLAKFVSDTRHIGGNPVLITPVSRRQFDSAGHVRQTHPGYSGAVWEIADSMHVPFIDLDTESRKLYQELGTEYSKLLFLHLKPDEHPNYPAGKNDNTHFNELGARKIAEIVLAEVRKKLPELAKHIRQPLIKNQNKDNLK